MSSGARSGQAGQGSVELVVLLPVVVAIGAAVLAVLSAGAAGRAADAAAEAGALAMLQGGEPRSAAREALAGWPRRSASVRVDGGRVVVTLEPRLMIPGLGRLLTATSRADAGPGAASRSVPLAARGGDGAASGPRDREEALRVPVEGVVTR